MPAGRSLRPGCGRVVLRLRRSLASLALLTAMFATVPPIAHATGFGLSDQFANHFADPRFEALPIDYVRLVVPWDVALTDPRSADEWLSTARNLGLVPLVAFQGNAAQRCPDDPCAVPSLRAYLEAFAAFRARWPEVDEFTPWNEPNHPDQPTADAPAAAAALHDALRRACPACTVVAGDVLDSDGAKQWLGRYREALQTRPLVWSLHNYGDAAHDRPSFTGWLVHAVDEPIWITETGGIVRLRSHGQDVMPYDEQRAAAATEKALDIVRSYPSRIARAYFYEWAASPGDGFDSGLVRPDGSPRPALSIVQDALAAPGARPGCHRSRGLQRQRPAPAEPRPHADHGRCPRSLPLAAHPVPPVAVLPWVVDVDGRPKHPWPPAPACLPVLRHPSRSCAARPGDGVRRGASASEAPRRAFSDRNRCDGSPGRDRRVGLADAAHRLRR
jgi:hypothetical protein